MNCTFIFSRLKFTSIIYVIFFFNSIYSQSLLQRTDFYKKLVSTGETYIKSFNASKQNVEYLIFNDQHPGGYGNGKVNRTEFQSVYQLFLIDFSNLQSIYENQFSQMNRFTEMPDMVYLQKMEKIQNDQINILKEGIRFFEEISTEINSKSFNRWNPNVIDDFLKNSFLNNDFIIYKNLRPVCIELDRLKKIYDCISYLNCAYNNWEFMHYYGFKELSHVNPLNNYNLNNYINNLQTHPDPVSNSKSVNFNDSWSRNPYESYGPDLKSDSYPKYQGLSYKMPNQFEFNIKRKDNDYLDTNFDFRIVNFKNLNNYSYVKSWFIHDEVLDYSLNKEKNYSNEIANSNSSLLLVFLLKSLDFENSTLNKLFKECFMKFKECKCKTFRVTELQSALVTELDYGSKSYDSWYLKFNHPTIVKNIQKNQEIIKRLDLLIPENSPWFHPKFQSKDLINEIKNLDTNWFNVYEIKKNLILSNLLYVSISNDIKLNNLKLDFFDNWYNKSMKKNMLNLYYQNEYMLSFGKSMPSVWLRDKKHLDSVIFNLKMIKSTIKFNFNNFKQFYEDSLSPYSLDSMFKNNSNNLKLIDIKNITEDYNNEFYFSNIIENKKSKSLTSKELDSLGYRCLKNNFLDISKSYFNESMLLDSNYFNSFIHYGHLLYKIGEIEESKKYYFNFPIEKLNNQEKEKINYELQELSSYDIFDIEKVKEIKILLGI
jgi:hypothetical protein